MGRRPVRRRIGGRWVTFWIVDRQWITRQKPRVRAAPKAPRFTYRMVNGQRVRYFWYNGGWRNYADYYSQYIQFSWIKDVTVGGRRVRLMYYRGKWVPYNSGIWYAYLTRISPKPAQTKTEV